MVFSAEASCLRQQGWYNQPSHVCYIFSLYKVTMHLFYYFAFMRSY